MSSSPDCHFSLQDAMKHLPVLFLALACLLQCATAPASAATLSVGPYNYSATDPFIVPIEVTGASNLASFAFDVDFDATAFMINTACDPFTDSYCDFSTGPVTLGTFYTNAATFPPLFNPGFILLNGSGNQTGQLLGVNGAWQDPGPAPSGDGILAFIECVAVAGGSPTGSITVIDESGSVPEPASALLVASGFALMALGLRRRSHSIVSIRTK